MSYYTVYVIEENRVRYYVEAKGPDDAIEVVLEGNHTGKVEHSEWTKMDVIEE
jgi:hypothetical protein